MYSHGDKLLALRSVTQEEDHENIEGRGKKVAKVKQFQITS